MLERILCEYLKIKVTEESQVIVDTDLDFTLVNFNYLSPREFAQIVELFEPQRDFIESLGDPYDDSKLLERVISLHQDEIDALLEQSSDVLFASTDCLERQPAPTTLRELRKQIANAITTKNSIAYTTSISRLRLKAEALVLGRVLEKLNALDKPPENPGLDLAL